MYLKTTMYLFLIVSCNQLAFASSIGIDDPKIEKIQGNVYKVTTVNGERFLSRIGANSDNVNENKWWTYGDGRKCENNLALLSRHDAAVGIENTDYIVAFLECPAERDFSTGTLITLFNKKNVSESVCASYIDLSKNQSKYYWGGVSYVGAYKKSKGKGFYLVSTMEGGDGGGSWKGIDIFSFTSKCELSLISRSYADQYHDLENSRNCSGEKMDYKIVGDTVTIVRKEVSCKSGSELITGQKKETIRLERKVEPLPKVHRTK